MLKLILENGVPSIQSLFSQGGWVLWLITVLALSVFVLGFERIYFYRFSFRRQIVVLQARWLARQERQSWRAHRIRDALLAEAEQALNHSLWFVRFAVIVCPLLGLLGTVSGMISVFDVLSYLGTGNPRLMAAGVFQATIPTMAGMLVAIVGLIFKARLAREFSYCQQQVRAALTD